MTTAAVAVGIAELPEVVEEAATGRMICACTAALATAERAVDGEYIRGTPWSLNGPAVMLYYTGILEGTWEETTRQWSCDQESGLWISTRVGNSGRWIDSARSDRGIAVRYPYPAFWELDSWK